jgi:hypothetical protein
MQRKRRTLVAAAVAALGTVALVAAIAVASPAEAAPKRLVATVGPGSTISLKTPLGRAVRTIPAGTYTIAVTDKSDEHNFRLSGARVSKATSVDSTGRATWTVKLARGKTYRFWCDPHADDMKGSFRVR